MVNWLNAIALIDPPGTILSSVDIYPSNWGFTSYEDVLNKVPGPIDVRDYEIEHQGIESA